MPESFGKHRLSASSFHLEFAIKLTSFVLIACGRVTRLSMPNSIYKFECLR